jgi:cytochrome c oxidase assembly protein subunit 15
MEHGLGAGKMIALPKATLAKATLARTTLARAFMALAPEPDVPGRRAPAVAIWLFAVAALVFMMVMVGGATRLTGSGLSITEWKPISGALPPLGDAAWGEMFRKYRASSQYRLVNQGISLADFKGLFWWEWAHRLLARCVGAAFALPFLGFIALRRLPARLMGRCLALFGLGGLQGLVGWWMVESGLEGRASVAPERLAVHLGLALLLLCALVWTGLEAWAGAAPAERRGRDGWRWIPALFAGGVFAQCLMGALVAGNGAGRVDNDWPLMGGRFFPDDYWRGAWWTTLAHGRAAVQFNHRLVAYALLGLGLALAVAALRNRSAPRALVGLTLLAMALLLLQAGLGVATLMAGDPPGLALIHQANAVLLLSVAVWAAWRARRA